MREKQAPPGMMLRWKPSPCSNRQLDDVAKAGREGARWGRFVILLTLAACGLALSRLRLAGLLYYLEF